MANLDTAEKRRSGSQTLSGLFGPGVTPNTSKDQEWRQQVCWGYSGILADQLIVWTRIEPSQAASWTRIEPSQTTTWTRIEPTQNASWARITH